MLRSMTGGISLLSLAVNEWTSDSHYKWWQLQIFLSGLWIEMFWISYITILVQIDRSNSGIVPLLWWHWWAFYISVILIVDETELNLTSSCGGKFTIWVNNFRMIKIAKHWEWFIITTSIRQTYWFLHKIKGFTKDIVSCIYSYSFITRSNLSHQWLSTRLL